MKNILVTGGAGFIGSNFIRYVLLNEPGVRITNLDALTYAGHLENLDGLPHPDAHTFVKGDICDRPLVERLLRENEIDTVVHFAAETHVDRSILDPEPFIRTNVMGTFTLLDAARLYWQKEKHWDASRVRFHHVSTDEVFGSLAPGDPAWTETTPYAPSSPYSASKTSSDHLARAYFHTYGLPVSITNCTNNYGPRQFPEKLIPLMVLNAATGKPLPVYGDGQQVRDWLYVDDHCDAILRVIQRGRPGETYNVGGGNQPPNLEVIHTLCDIMDELRPNSPFIPHDSLIKTVPDRPGHDRRYAMDITHIHTELGWQPAESMKTGLLKTVEWYLANSEWVDKIHQAGDYRAWMERNYQNREEINK
jgi:dTDP-glucose 4,6-dehydratase